MPDRKKIIEADDLLHDKKLQDLLRERGWRIDKPHILSSGDVIALRFVKLPNGEGGEQNGTIR